MRPIQPVSVAGIEFDALIDSDETYTATVPKYPVDTGYSVSDNMALDNLDLKMTLYLTATPITWRGSHGSGVSRMQSVCDQLMQLYFNRDMFTVVTQDKVFSNMVVESIEIKKSDTQGYAREIPVSFRQVTVTAAGATQIPTSLPRGGKTGASTGGAATTTLPATTQVSTQTAQAASSGSSGSSSGGGVDERSLHNGTMNTSYKELARLANGVKTTYDKAVREASR